MAISRALMRRQLRSQGGIMQLEPRQQYGLGSLVKSITKPIKKAVSAVGDFASSDIGKMALLAAGGYYLGGGAIGPFQRAGMSGFSFGNLAPSALKSSLLGTVEAGSGLYGGGPLSGVMNALQGSKIGSALLSSKGLKTGAAILGGSALMSSLFGSPEQAKQLYSERPTFVKQYLAQYYRNINKDRDVTDEEVEQFVNEQTREYAANGGRIGFEEGGILSLEEAKKRDPAMFMDTTTYNPIPENAPNMAADEIAKVIMGTLGLEGPEDQLDLPEGEERPMSSREFIFKSYVMPKRKELMENFGLSLQEADDLIREGMAKIRDKKADGGMPTGIMRTNQAGVMERDYREEGGFVPVGIKEKADDVPAMLSKNEFVFTADAVRGAGNGDVEKGAQRMYKVMKTLENGGTV